MIWPPEDDQSVQVARGKSTPLVGSHNRRPVRAELFHPHSNKVAVMDTWEKRHDAAQRYVDTARRAIDHQRSIIASQTALRLNSQASHDLLPVIERAQEIFESTLARLQAEREREQSA
jgi:hypothetical protein